MNLSSEKLGSKQNYLSEKSTKKAPISIKI